MDLNYKTLEIGSVILNASDFGSVIILFHRLLYRTYHTIRRMQKVFQRLEYRMKKENEVNAMKKVRITAIRQTVYHDLMEKYENPIEHACDVEVGMSWISADGEKPEGF